MKILLVEDNPVTVEVLRPALEKDRHDVVAAASVPDALDALRTHPDLALVVTDIQLGAASGLELLTALRRAPEWQDVPVIVATAQADRETVTRAAALGCRHFLVKPVGPRQLRHEVKDALAAAIPVLDDSDAVRERLGLDRAAYDKLVLAFATLVAEKRAVLEALADTDTSGDRAPMATLAPDLAALTEGAGLVGAARLLRVLGRCGVVDDAIAEADAMLRALRHELRVLQATLPSLAPPAPVDETPPAADAEST